MDGDKKLSLESISFPPSGNNSPSKLLVFLHGWGANAQDVGGLASFINLPDYQIICPDAPFPHFQVPLGKAWYALERDDYQGLTESRSLLKQWLLSLESTTQIALSDTVLIGFSQGGAMTYDVGLSLPLAGLGILSGYLHSQPQVESDRQPPVLIVHGVRDQVVPLAAARKAKDELTNLGLDIDYHELNIGHEISLPVLDLIKNFVTSIS